MYDSHSGDYWEITLACNNLNTADSHVNNKSQLNYTNTISYLQNTLLNILRIKHFQPRQFPFNPGTLLIHLIVFAMLLCFVDPLIVGSRYGKVRGRTLLFWVGPCCFWEKPLMTPDVPTMGFRLRVSSPP